jgi:ectoine hydroxylase-related dioxygenase (phytanoyl-CoA dioxygenase family)
MDNGSLRVIPGSHQAGKYGENELAKIVAGNSATDVHMRRGAILLMRPLLVHSSPPARAAEHRRVLHIELAPLDAISPLQWQTAVQLRRAA